MYNEKLILQRKRLKLTQIECAKLMGVSTQTWSRWETGNRNMTPSHKILWSLVRARLKSERRN